MNTPAPAVAAYVTTYAARTPYLTVAEWLAAPTAVDISDLVPDGTREEQEQSLSDCILRASSWIDDVCQQVLAATTDTAFGRYRVNGSGVIRMPLQYKPVLEVSAILIGGAPGKLAPMSDLSGVAIYPTGVIEIPVGASAESRPIVQATYVNGWPNTLSSDAVEAGSSSLPVESALGVYPGTVLTVSDSASTELVQVTGDYTAGALTLPLSVPLGSAHAAGVSVSALPARVKEAAVLLTTAMVQTRGNDAIVLAALNEPSQMTAESGSPVGNVQMAKAMLGSRRRVW